MNFATKAIRVAQNPDSDYRAVINPIYQSATYVWENLDTLPKFDYTRVSSPNRATLEHVIASLEGAEFGVCMSSGMAAVSAALSLLQSSDHVLVANDIYGGTQRIANIFLPRQNIEATNFDACDPSDFDRKLQPNTKMVLFEGPTNPLLRIPNIKVLADKARAVGVISVFDNTFASPALQRPFDHGVDIVIHSTTKYICGHSDVIGGCILTNNREFYDAFFLFTKAIGLSPSPFDNWLTLRGAKTMALRIRQHCENARAVAAFLERDPRVKKVYYPGLESHPDHELAKSQMSDFGGIVSFEVDGTVEQAKRVAEATKIFLLAESLGGVESLLGYPALMSHGCLTEEERLAKGIFPTLLRLSVGIEDVEDILEDLDQALTVGVGALPRGIELPATEVAVAG